MNIEIHGGVSPLEGRAARFLEGTSPVAVHVATRLAILDHRDADERAALQGRVDADEQAAYAHTEAVAALARRRDEAQGRPIVRDVDQYNRPLSAPLAVVEGQVRHIESGAIHMTASALAKAEADVRRTGESRARTKAAVEAGVARVRARAEPRANARNALIGYKGNEPELATNVKPAKSIPDAEQALAALRAERRRNEAATQPAAALKAKARSVLEDIAESGRIRVSKDGDVLWPTRGGRFSARPGDDLNVRGLLAAAHFEDLLIEAESQIDIAHATVDLALTPAQKVAALAKIDADIDAVERAIAEAVWKAIEAGDDSIEFPPGISGAALLGIAL